MRPNIRFVDWCFPGAWRLVLGAFRRVRQRVERAVRWVVKPVLCYEYDPQKRAGMAPALLHCHFTHVSLPITGTPS